MNREKIQKLLYDLERETDAKKAHELILKYSDTFIIQKDYLKIKEISEKYNVKWRNSVYENNHASTEKLYTIQDLKEFPEKVLKDLKNKIIKEEINTPLRANSLVSLGMSSIMLQTWENMLNEGKELIGLGHLTIGNKSNEIIYQLNYFRKVLDTDLASLSKDNIDNKTWYMKDKIDYVNRNVKYTGGL